ncbi:hypothetical protein [Pelistega suis]|uniref:Uncharacterized protein n=1 Tax=Pelistega suis TaxID=1631957 RepID=A0A849P7K9_9BURK|nr:hypothetical protein [Pelistega suis]NOL50957.1 hypothetical protein [Pelistega suis]
MIKKMLLATLMLIVGASAFAQTEDELVSKYQQARIAVTYKGSVGDLAQQLAQQLSIPYYAMQHQPTVQIRLKQDDSKTIQDLLDEINRQLTHQKIRFDVLDDKVVLALTSKEITSLVTPQFIGQVIFADGQKPVNSEVSPVNELNHISTPVIDGAKEVQESTLDNKAIAPVKQAVAEPEIPAEKEEEAKKLKAILEMSQDEKLLAQYAKRKQPLFTIEDKKAIKLDAVRSTKISTFLIFEEGVDVSQYKIEGDFQDMARLDNVVAILHRQKSPPRSFAIITPDGVKQTIQRAP